MIAEGHCGFVAEDKSVSTPGSSPGNFPDQALNRDHICRPVPGARGEEYGRTVWDGSVVRLFIIAIACEGVGNPGKFGFDQSVGDGIVEALFDEIIGQYTIAPSTVVQIRVMYAGLTGPVMTFFDLVVHVPTSAASYCALTVAARPKEMATMVFIEGIIFVSLVVRGEEGMDLEKETPCSKERGKMLVRVSLGK